MLPIKVTVAFTAVLLIMVVPSTTGERILLFFPLSTKSMANLFEPLTRGLLERGHEVKIVTPEKFKITSTNFTQLHPITAEELFQDFPEPFELRRQSRLFRYPPSHQQKYCNKLFQMEDIRNLANEKFDVMIVNVIYHDCFAGIFHRIRSPIILFATLPLPSAFLEHLGNPMPSSFVQNCYFKEVSAQLTFAHRIKQFLFNVYFSYMMEYNRRSMEPIYKEYLGQDLPSVNEIYAKQTSLVLMNSHFTVTSPRPLLPSIVEIGGIHCKDAGRLPKDLEEFVGNAKDGFIVFSLGSVIRADQIPELVRQSFVKSFGKLKQRVIWKWEKDGGMPDLPSNVKLVKWLPQQDILGHPNIKLFITHGGLLSTEEALWHGVPILGMPVFIDQDANMKQAEILGFGVKGEILDLTEPVLTANIKKVLEEPRYMKKAKELSKIFRDQPESALDRALYFVEYVIRHNGAYHLRSAGMNLNMIQYYCVDVVAFLAAIIISIGLFTCYLIKLFIRMITRVFKSNTMNMQKESAPKRKYL